jgi:guanylate kinase
MFRRRRGKVIRSCWFLRNDGWVDYDNWMKSLIVIGPSGVGKGTVISSLIRKHPLFQFVLSFTTRPPRKS